MGTVIAGCAAPPPDSGSTPGESPEDLTGFYEQELTWDSCGGGFECAWFEVPLDYDNPGEETVEIAVRRLPASGDDPVGSLVVNPGGPGGSGVDYVGQSLSTMSPELLTEFDVVGFDPRGVGYSEPLECLDTAGVDAYLGAGIVPEEDGSLTEASRTELDERNAEFIAGCEAELGEDLRHLGTANVARDMDILRELLGDERLSYLGKSYGTYLGTHYAARFPENVRAAVLDGAVDPTLSSLEMGTQQAEGFQTALEAFVADCVDQRDCVLGAESDGTPEGAMAELEEFVAGTAEEPLENGLGDGREVNATWTELGLLSALYNEASWPVVRDALTAAYDGDGTELLRLADNLYGRSHDGPYENMTSVLVSVNCIDRPGTEDVDTIQDAANRAAEESPIFGPSLAWGAHVCTDWPGTEPVEQDFSAVGAAPLLVVGTTRDPATPHVWAERLAGELESGVLLTYDGDGHTAYRMGDPCVDAAVDEYLIEGRPPADGTVCPGD
nr:alpha/beta hydrolase [Spiractinospora alimapuensis]